MLKLFDGGGEVGALMRDKDWSATLARAARHLAAEPANHRPHHADVALRDVDGLGPRPHVLLQRRLRAMTLGAKHPWALGRPTREVWAEIWDAASARASSTFWTAATRRGTKRCCSSSSATAIPRRPTTRSRTARCPTIEGNVCGQFLRRHRGDRARHRRAAAGARCARWPPAWPRRRPTATCSPPSRAGDCRGAARPAVRADLSCSTRRASRRSWSRASGIAEAHPSARRVDRRSTRPAGSGRSRR